MKKDHKEQDEILEEVIPEEEEEEEEEEEGNESRNLVEVSTLDSIRYRVKSTKSGLYLPLFYKRVSGETREDMKARIQNSLSEYKEAWKRGFLVIEEYDATRLAAPRARVSVLEEGVEVESKEFRSLDKAKKWARMYALIGYSVKVFNEAKEEVEFADVTTKEK